jgi:predicted XRE-type DNA-binding protein
MNKRINVEAIASKVKSQMMSDVRSELISLFEKTGVDARVLAENLHISIDEINAVMNQDASSLSLDAFVKLLITTGNALEVKPVPMMGRTKQNAKRFHTPIFPTASCSRPWERPSNIEPMAMENRFNPFTDLCGKTRAELGAIITNNNWNREINIATASREEMIDFIVSKNNTPTNRINETVNEDMCLDNVAPTFSEPEPSMSFDAMMDAFKEFVRNNPQVISTR